MHPPRWAIVPSLAFVALLTFLTYSYLGFSSSGLSTPGVTHIVMFKWKDEADEASIAEVNISRLPFPFLSSPHHPPLPK